jgi:hypothetical protein
LRTIGGAILKCEEKKTTTKTKKPSSMYRDTLYTGTVECCATYIIMYVNL